MSFVWACMYASVSDWTLLVNFGTQRFLESWRHAWLTRWPAGPRGTVSAVFLIGCDSMVTDFPPPQIFGWQTNIGSGVSDKPNGIEYSPLVGNNYNKTWQNLAAVPRSKVILWLNGTELTTYSLLMKSVLQSGSTGRESKWQYLVLIKLPIFLTKWGLLIWSHCNLLELNDWICQSLPFAASCVWGTVGEILRSHPIYACRLVFIYLFLFILVDRYTTDRQFLG
jgi:hypothetical protein